MHLFWALPPIPSRFPPTFPLLHGWGAVKHPTHLGPMLLAWHVRPIPTFCGHATCTACPPLQPWLRSHSNTLMLGAHTTCTVCQPHPQPFLPINIGIPFYHG